MQIPEATSHRILPAVAVIVGLLAVPTLSQAAATAHLVWSATTGTGATGTNLTRALLGDTLTLDILYTVDGDGVNRIALSIEFDYDGQDWLDLVPGSVQEFAHKATFACTPFPTCVISFGPELGNFNPGVTQTRESSLGFTGSVGTFEQGNTAAAPGPSFKTILIGRVQFVVGRLEEFGPPIRSSAWDSCRPRTDTGTTTSSGLDPMTSRTRTSKETRRSSSSLVSPSPAPGYS